MAKAINEAVRTEILAAKRNDPSLSARKLSSLFGLHHSTISDMFKVSESSAPKSTESIEVDGDNLTIVMPKTTIHTLEELIEHCKIDLGVWEVDRFVANKWEMGAKDAEGDIQVTPLFQIKAFLKRRKDIVATKNEIADLKKFAADQASKPLSTYVHREKGGLMLEVNIPDLHVGKLAWGEETGYGNYDVKIAVKIFERALDTLIERTKAHSFDQVLFVVGNDLLNSDDVEGRTTAGTHVTTDGRYQKTFAEVRSMKIRAIEKLRAVAPVRVVMVGGNHDWLSCWHLGDSLECYFHNYDDVTVDNSPKFRKYHQFGKVLLMMCHGHKGKRAEYGFLMATEEPKMFGNTKFREAHTGHLHGDKVNEKYGVKVRILSALCAADDWHSQNAYVGNLRSAEAFIWSAEEGLIGTAIHTEVD